MELPRAVESSLAVSAAATEKTKVMMMTVKPYRLHSSRTIADLQIDSNVYTQDIITRRSRSTQFSLFLTKQSSTY